MVCKIKFFVLSIVFSVLASYSLYGQHSLLKEYIYWEDYQLAKMYPISDEYPNPAIDSITYIELIADRKGNISNKRLYETNVYPVYIFGANIPILKLGKKFNRFRHIKIFNLPIAQKMVAKKIEPMQDLIFFRGQLLSKLPNFVYDSPNLRFLEFAPRKIGDIRIDKLKRMKSLKAILLNIESNELLTYLENNGLYDFENIEWLEFKSITSKLRELNISLNKVSQMKNLKYLSLYSDLSPYLSDLDKLQKIEGLSFIDFSKKDFETLAKKINNMPNLKYFWISGLKSEEMEKLKSLVPHVKFYW